MPPTLPQEPRSISGTKSSDTMHRPWLWFSSFCLLLLPTCLAQAHPSDSLLRGQHTQERDMKQDRRRAVEQVLEYYEEPKLEWTSRLEDGKLQPAKLARGNAIMASPFDDDLLYITTQTGQLAVVSATNGTTLATIYPTVRTSPTGTGTIGRWKSTCRSGVTFGEVDVIGKFAIYAIVDEPPEETDIAFGPQSRILAVSIPSHDLLWTSANLPGTIQGTPVIDSNRLDPRRKYVLLTRNTNVVLVDDQDATNSTTGGVIGHLTMLKATNGNVVWTQAETDIDFIEEVDAQGYGPLGWADNPKKGLYAGGMQNINDLIVWTNSMSEGRANIGYTFAFQLPPLFHESQAQVATLASVVLKKVRWNAAAKPALSTDGTQLFFGVTGSELRAWVGDQPFDDLAAWSTVLVTDAQEPNAAIPAAPVLSRDESRLFVSSASTEVVCVDAQSGDTLWALLGTSAFLAEAKVSPDDSLVFNMQSADGRVYCNDQITGETLWVAACDSFEFFSGEDCINNVQAEFALSNSGQYLYYGDVIGRIVALKLGYLIDAPIDPPTLAPVQATPIAPPTLAPVQAPTRQAVPPVFAPQDPESPEWPTVAESQQQNSNMKRGLTLGGSIALIMIAVIIGIGASIYIYTVTHFKTYPHPQQEPHLPVDAIDDHDMHLVQPYDHPEEHPDPYEDAMISKLQPTKEKHPEDYVPKAYHSDDPYRKQDFDDHDNYSHARADRIPHKLGTSNRIVPISGPGTRGAEDYYHGASQHPQDDFPGTYHIDDQYRKQFPDDFDNYSHAPADRISQRLGTSNSVMPISAPGTRGAEDYSYGASLIL